MFISLILALIPGLFIVRRLDQNNYLAHTDISLRRRLFILGALSVFSAIALELAGSDIFLDMPETTYQYLYYDNFLVTAFSEELGKFLILLSAAGYMKKTSEKLMDECPGYAKADKIMMIAGAVPGIYIGLGFGIAENILYALDGDITVMLLRAVFSVPGHAMYGLYMGYFLCRAVNGKHLLPNMFAAFMIPVLQHGLYDFCLSGDNDILIAWCLLYNIILYVNACRMLCIPRPKQVARIQTSFDVLSTSIS